MRKIFSLHTVLFTLAVLALSAAMSAPSPAQVRISVGFGPPALPVYDQPLCPGDGYLWTPGYWGWDADFDDYYWIPGTWILAPEVGFFWTPPYWGWDNGAFLFYDGYWGPEIGFYGGIDYGFGYFGTGFVGGRWEGGHFFYNRAVLNINVENIHNVYNQTVEHNVVNHVSYNGGEGGITARPTAQEEAASRARHVGPVAAQTQHINAARGNPEMRASANHGKPAIAATARPGDFKSGAVASREAGGEYTPHPSHAATAGGTHAVHPNDLAPIERATPNTGNAKNDQKYQRDQDKLIAKQTQERQKLQQQQDKEHAKLAKQNADDAKKTQVEQRHQQQTNEMVQKHTQQRQQLQQRYSPPPAPERGGRK
ncbi:MAG: YXWGXW repeat-containing protein [Terriglobales bacterium]